MQNNHVQALSSIQHRAGIPEERKCSRWPQIYPDFLEAFSRNRMGKWRLHRELPHWQRNKDQKTELLKQLKFGEQVISHKGRCYREKKPQNLNRGSPRVLSESLSYVREGWGSEKPGREKLPRHQKLKRNIRDFIVLGKHSPSQRGQTRVSTLAIQLQRQNAHSCK